MPYPVAAPRPVVVPPIIVIPPLTDLVLLEDGSAILFENSDRMLLEL